MAVATVEASPALPICSSSIWLWGACHHVGVGYVGSSIKRVEMHTPEGLIPRGADNIDLCASRCHSASTTGKMPSSRRRAPYPQQSPLTSPREPRRWLVSSGSLPPRVSRDLHDGGTQT